MSWVASTRDEISHRSNSKEHTARKFCQHFCATQCFVRAANCVGHTVSAFGQLHDVTRKLPYVLQRMQQARKRACCSIADMTAAHPEASPRRA